MSTNTTILWHWRRRALSLGSVGACVCHQVPADASGDPRRGVLDRIPGEVCVTRGHLDLRVTQEFSNHREAFAEREGPTGVRMPEVMNSHVLQVGAFADAPSGALQIGEVGAQQFAGDDPGIVVVAGKALSPC